MKSKLRFTLIMILIAAIVLGGCGLKNLVSESTASKASASKSTFSKASVSGTPISNESSSKASASENTASKASVSKNTASKASVSESTTGQEANDGGTKEEKATSENATFPVLPHTVHVKTAKELLEAIAPDTQIVLESGKYNLSEALEDTDLSKYEDYLQPVYGDESEIVICNIDNLTILGPTDSVAQIVVNNPTASTLSFLECEDICVSNVTVGHDVEKGTCSGAVIRLDHCNGVTLNKDDLYGCGTYGVEAYNCTGIRANDCTVRECTYGILSIYTCSDTVFNNCVFKECEKLDLIATSDSGIIFNECDFTQNKTDYDFISKGAYSSVIFKACSFGREETDRINEIHGFEGLCYFDNECKFDGNFLSSYTTVSNAKEFIEAIESGATICVEPGIYNLTECACDIIENRGNSWMSSHKHISFEEEFDGIEVVLKEINDLTIIGLGISPSDVEFVVDPRYAEVFRLVDCNDISFLNLTAGHTDRGTCVGDVVGIEGGKGFVFDYVDLYGCGVNGIGAGMEFSDIRVYDSVIRDCSDSPFSLYGGTGSVEVLNTSMYGSGSPGGYGEGDYQVYFQNCDFGVYESLGLNPMNEEAEKKISMFACTFADTSRYEDYAYEW